MQCDYAGSFEGVEGVSRVGRNSDRDYERIQNAENLPYSCFRYFLKKWSAL